MNPFELRGPDFLLFFIVLSVVSLFVIRWIRRKIDGIGSPAMLSPQTLVSDPYLIAQLRDGPAETLRVALISLVDRGLIDYQNNQFTTATHVSAAHGRHLVEREVLTAFKGGNDAKVLESLTSVTSEYDERLKSLGLLPDDDVVTRRKWLFTLGLVILGGTAAAKIVIGILRDRPVVLLVILGVIVLVLLRAAVFPRRTAQGNEFLASVQRLFAGLRSRAKELKRGGATAELALLAGAFGAVTIPASLFPYTTQLFPPKPVSSSSCSSSSSSCSSSSCGGGGGCGGGGCGGCGS